jgi:heptosyltransferase-3
VKALVVRAGALGDLLLLRPVVASLRRAGMDVTLLAPERPGSALLGPGPDDASALIPWDRAEVARAASGEDVPSLGTYDVTLCYSRAADLARGLAHRARQLVVHDPAPAAAHAADWLARPLVEVGVDHVDPLPLVPTSEERGAVAAVLATLPADFLAVHPGSGSPRKNWPADRFAELARRCGGDRWLLSLGPADEAEAAALDGTAGASITRDLPPRRLGALLSAAGVYVGNDSGVTHLAAAYGVPTVALFGPTAPETWHPIGARVRVLAAPNGRLDELSVDAVQRAAEACRR